MARLIGIARVSSDEQAGDNGEGLERQRVNIRNVAARLGVPNVTIVDVVGVSGSDLADTPQWKATIAPAVSQGADIVVDSLDRLIRASAFDFRVLQLLLAHKAKVVLPSNSYDTTNPRDRMTLTIFAGVGGYERSEIARRANEGKEAKRRAGHWVQDPALLPLGVTYDKKAKVWGYNGDIDLNG